MPEPIPSGPARENPPAPERTPRWSLGLTAVLVGLWLVVVLGADWLAPRIAGIVNDLDLRYGLTAPPAAAPEPET